MPGSVLVVDDVATKRRATCARLSHACCDVMEAGSGQEALALALSEQPDTILLDVVMPGMDGFETCRRLKADPRTAHLPVIMLTALDDRESRLHGFDCGCDDFLSLPFDSGSLLTRLTRLTRMKRLVDDLRMRPEAPGESPLDLALPDEGRDLRILLAAEDRALAAELAALIEGRFDATCTCVASEAEARDALASGPFDAVIAGPRLQEGRTLRLAAAVRGRAAWRNLVLMLILEPGDSAAEMMATDMDVSDTLTMPPDPGELLARLRGQLRRKRFADQLRRSLSERVEMALTDPLTGLWNRHYSDRRLGELVERAGRLAQPLLVLMLDLDAFKAVNDRHGHAAGDRVLSEFALRLRASTRRDDLLARLGGEEFLVAMPDLPPAAARQVAERLREAVEDTPFSLGRGRGKVALTVSIGMAACRAGESAASLLERADRALYASKRAGRNRVTVAEA
jgi:two-component system cell cycle response regulator